MLQTRNRSLQKLPLLEKCKQLITETRKLNISEVTKLLKAGALPNFIDLSTPFAWTPIHLAIPESGNSSSSDNTQTLNSLKILQLFSHYCSSNAFFAENGNGVNPFELSIAEADISIVEWFLTIMNDNPHLKHFINHKNNLPSNDTRCSGQTPLHMALRREDHAIVLLLVKAGSSTISPEVNGLTAIHLAIERRLPECLLPILEYTHFSELQAEYQHMTVLQFASHHMNIMQETVVQPIKILHAQQCLALVKSRIAIGNTENKNAESSSSYVSLRKEWMKIRAKFRIPLKNKIMTFPMNRISNNSNFSGNIIQIRSKKTTLKNVFEKQFRDIDWCSIYHGSPVMSSDLRILRYQKLSPSAQQLKKLVHRSQALMAVPGKHKIQALNLKLQEEITIDDERNIFKMSVGNKEHNKYFELREILDISHPCKRRNKNKRIYGVFAKIDIPRKTYIMEYLGEVMTNDEYTQRMNGFDRHSAKRRNLRLDTFHDKRNQTESFITGYLIDSSYYSNECVFVNDKRDDVFNNSRSHNASFFEITIDGWPHMFLRAYLNIKAGEEILTEYGMKFWKDFNEDIIEEQKLINYYSYKIQRKREVEELKANDTLVHQQSLIDVLDTSSDEPLQIERKRKLSKNYRNIDH